MRWSVASMMILCLMALVSANACGSDQGIQAHGLNEPGYHLMESNVLERPFHLHIRLPADYRGSDQQYPVAYLLDGGFTFPMLAGYMSYLVMGGDAPEMILVGISYGNSDWQKGNLRSTDFTAPAMGHDHYGGAGPFLDFFREELIPFVEQAYSADPSKRVLFGQSLGGQFVLFAAQNEPNLFHGYIASNPALHRNLEYFLKMSPAVRSGDARVFVSSGTEDEPRFRLPAQKWIRHWTAKPGLPWALKTMDIEGQNHFSAAPEAFRQGLRWIF